MTKIFISYRRGDVDRQAAGRIADRLEREGFDVFMDVEMQPGVNFPKAIERAVAECDAFLAVIGEDWLAAGGQSGARLDAPDDFVRLELQQALARDDVLVIPVLIEDVEMPSRRDLPEAVRGLADLHAQRLRHEGWREGMLKLLAALPTRTPSTPDEPRSGTEAGHDDDIVQDDIAPEETGAGDEQPVLTDEEEPRHRDEQNGSRRRRAVAAALLAAGVAAVVVVLLVVLGGDDGGSDDKANAAYTAALQAAFGPLTVANRELKLGLGHLESAPPAARNLAKLDRLADARDEAAAQFRRATVPETTEAEELSQVARAALSAELGYIEALGPALSQPNAERARVVDTAQSRLRDAFGELGVAAPGSVSSVNGMGALVDWSARWAGSGEPWHGPENGGGGNGGGGGHADADDDGFSPPEDCNDDDDTINPDASEIPGDGIDQDCDGQDGTEPVDGDEDGFSPPEDCNDGDAAINPDATEVTGDGVDQNCDGAD